MTQASSFARILTDLPRRSLAIPPPGGTLEEVVVSAVNKLAKKYKADLEQAEETIEKYGLTIEVNRLRERLARAATSDVERLVLSTPGVPEALFNKAVEKELEEAQAGESRSGGSGKPPNGAAGARKRPAPKPASGGAKAAPRSNTDPALADAGARPGGEQS
jgi:hypothetical protein